VSNRVLLVEDEQTIRRAIGYALRREGFEVEEACDGETALDASEPRFDLVILDLMLPKLSGTDVLRRVRAQSAVPIIVVTAKDTEVDRVLGLELGADDYVTKPFSMAELMSRVRALLRRRELDQAGGSWVAEVGSLSVDLARHEVTVRGRRVTLTSSEFKILALLAREPGTVVDRRAIMQTLWHGSHAGGVHVCDVHVSNLRRKLERDPANPELIVTVRGAGYKLVPPPPEDGDGSRSLEQA
jgi:two-component system response regulator RegX3